MTNTTYTELDIMWDLYGTMGMLLPYSHRGILNSNVVAEYIEQYIGFILLLHLQHPRLIGNGSCPTLT